MDPEEYLTVDELAARLKLSRKTIRNKITNGTFRKGVHYFRPKGLRPRFKWSAIKAWLEEEDVAEKDDMRIPMARGYFLGEGRKKT